MEGPATMAGAVTEVTIRRVGGYHIGGEVVEVADAPKTEPLVFTPGAPPHSHDPNGHHMVGQMYAHYTLLAEPRAAQPLLMWHGGGMTGATWEDTPDGRPGWQWRFLQAGHDVYVTDAVERGRASWSLVPGAYGGEPVARTLAAAWTSFRFGPPEGYDPDPGKARPFEGQRFPVRALQQFGRQGVPRWTTTNAMTQAAYDALVAEVGPCVVMCHSQGGNFGYTAALNAPDKVRAVVAVEPSGRPETGARDLAVLRDVPHLVVWGDYLDRVAAWGTRRANGDAYAGELRAAGVPVDILDLPAQGIRGNSHFPMMDDNSDLVAEMVQDWMLAKGLVR